MSNVRIVPTVLAIGGSAARALNFLRPVARRVPAFARWTSVATCRAVIARVRPAVVVVDPDVFAFDPDGFCALAARAGTPLTLLDDRAPSAVLELLLAARGNTARQPAGRRGAS